MGREIIIGRQGNQKLRIDDMTVSRRHCKVTARDDGTFTVENLSSAGTKVDGVSIIRTTATAECRLQLGERFSASLAELIDMDSVSRRVNIPPTPQVQSVSIASLRFLYDNYCGEKVTIQKEEKKSNSAKAIASLCCMAITALSFILPDNGAMNAIKILSGVVTLCMLIYSFMSMKRNNSQAPERLAEIDKEFRIKHVCPHCGNFLGYEPFEALKNRGRCNFCKTKWTC